MGGYSYTFTHEEPILVDPEHGVQLLAASQGDPAPALHRPRHLRPHLLGDHTHLAQGGIFGENSRALYQKHVHGKY